jgi:CDP-paratose 2-epimerase
MRVLITGACGFVGSRLAHELKQRWENIELIGLDNLGRRGSETNIAPLRGLGVQFVHGDVRNAEDLAELPRCDWVIDCAANPSVLAGVDGGAAQLVAHNLGGTLNLLEKCRRDAAGIVILSSSRVYAIDQLNAIPLVESETRLRVAPDRDLPAGFSPRGVAEGFSTAAPVSLYGASKLASEIMALEYGAAFGFPVWIDRCGVIAGAGQFGKIDQGIFSFWIYQWTLGRALSYIGFGGRGLQVRDLISPADLAALLEQQLRQPAAAAPRIVNVGGGNARAMSLRELSDFCLRAIGPAPPLTSAPATRRYDIPFFVTDSTLAESAWNWRAAEPIEQTLEGIVRYARDHRAELTAFAG